MTNILDLDTEDVKMDNVKMDEMKFSFDPASRAFRRLVSEESICPSTIKLANIIIEKVQKSHDWKRRVTCSIINAPDYYSRLFESSDLTLFSPNFSPPFLQKNPKMMFDLAGNPFACLSARSLKVLVANVQPLVPLDRISKLLLLL